MIHRLRSLPFVFVARLAGSTSFGGTDRPSRRPTAAEMAGGSTARWSLRSPISLCLLALLLLSTQPAGAVDFVPDQVLVRLVPGGSIEAVNANWGTSVIDSFEDDFDTIYLLDAEGLGDLEQLVLDMATDPNIFEVELNLLEDTPEGIRQMVVIAIGGTTAEYEDQGLVDRISLPQAHETSTGLGVKVAILDTGIDMDHPIFAGRILPGGYDFVDEDDDPSEVSDGLDQDKDGLTDEGFGHGTMVAGVVHLVAPDATILPLRVLDDEGRGDVFRIIRAIRYARDMGVDVLNLSFGGPDNISMMQTEFERIEDLGIALVSGAGNENMDQDYFPGTSSKVFMVTALDSLDRKADFADWDGDVLVSAPGTGIRSAYPSGGWALGDGCSFAAPFVTGEVALIRSIRPNMDLDTLEDRIEDSVDGIYHIPANDPYDGELGSGRIDLAQAVQGLQTSDVAGGPGRDAGVFVFPNPASGRISFRLPEGDAATQLSVFDATGARVFTSSASGDLQPAFRWNARGRDGEPVASGVYFFRLESTEGARTGTFVIRR